MLHEEDYGGRPIGFEETILRKTKNIVMPGDVLIHLGDIALYRDEYWNKQLRAACAGKMWLIRGNHDKKTVTWYLEMGWDFVGDEILLHMYGKRVLFTHRPAPDGDHYDLNIHGHLHANKHHAPGGDKHRLVYMEHEYSPVSVRSIVEKKGVK
jgi:calcineurin-like phosphoesterase family protein